MPLNSQKPTRRILCISFSPIHADSRVLRQLEVLREFGEVTTVGYGEAPDGATRHIRVPNRASSLPRTPLGVLRLALRMHRTVELTAPAEKAVLHEVMSSGPYDLVVANDARALPLAFSVSDSTPVLADMHEWAAEEQAIVFTWKTLVGPYMEHLCSRYLPLTQGVTTVSKGLAELYRERYGTFAEVVRNAPDYQDIQPSPIDPRRIRLVHSGIADPERNLLSLIEAIERLGDQFTLDLYLLEVPGGHIELIRRKIRGKPWITLHSAVPPASLPVILNEYDLGVFLYPIRTLSHLHHLPNKFFDFVQARLGLVFSSAPEINSYINRYGLGIITSDESPGALVSALRNVTVDQIRGFKQRANQAAYELSNEPDRLVLRKVLANLLVAHE